jgi:hypothetical protein
MEELIDRLVANVGIDKATAEKAIGIILAFLRAEGPADKVQAIIDGLPGAEDAIKAGEAVSGGLGGLMGGGIMAVGAKLMSAGLGMGQISSVSREILDHARGKIGSDAVDEIVAGIPGLSQFV